LFCLLQWKYLVFAYVHEILHLLLLQARLQLALLLRCEPIAETRNVRYYSCASSAA
jgi:hypothetical protein